MTYIYKKDKDGNLENPVLKKIIEADNLNNQVNINDLSAQMAKVNKQLAARQAKQQAAQQEAEAATLFLGI